MVNHRTGRGFTYFWMAVCAAAVIGWWVLMAWLAIAGIHYLNTH